MGTLMRRFQVSVFRYLSFVFLSLSLIFQVQLNHGIYKNSCPTKCYDFAVLLTLPAMKSFSACNKLTGSSLKTIVSYSEDQITYMQKSARFLPIMRADLNLPMYLNVPIANSHCSWDTKRANTIQLCHYNVKHVYSQSLCFNKCFKVGTR